MKRSRLVFLPLAGIILVCIALLFGLRQDPKQIASALIGKPVPEFYQSDLLNSSRTLSNNDLPKTPFLINVWGSWCEYCKREHPFLMQLAAQNVSIVGLNYRDKVQNALEMLNKTGNPFSLVINDGKGELALKLGVDGAPETYLVDQHGVIQYRYVGELNETVWQQEFLPKIKELAP